MKKLIIIALGCAVAGGVMAESAGFQLSLTPDIAIKDRDTEINGVSIGVWNENPSPKFQWQFGFVNGTTGDSVGVQWLVLLPTFYNYAVGLARKLCRQYDRRSAWPGQYCRSR